MICSEQFFTKVSIFCCFDVCSVRSPQIFQVQAKISTVRPVFLDYLSVSNDYGRIYLFNYKICGKQYTGKTTDYFRNRWNNYKSEARKVESGNMKNVSKSSYRVFFYNNQIIKVFLKTWQLDSVTKHRVLTRPRETFTGLELSELCILIVWILRVTISNFYVFTITLGLF